VCVQIRQKVTGPETMEYWSHQPTIENRYHVFNAWWNQKPGAYQLEFSVWDGDKVRHI
jgi:hypothetical protein